MTAVTNDILIEQGATFDMQLVYALGSPAIPANLTGWTARMQVRVEPDDPDPPLLNLTTENGGITLSSTGQITVMGLASLTKLLPTRAGVYDLEIANGAIVRRVVRGSVCVSPEVTTLEAPGSSTPSWLPAGVVVYADFVNNRYWSQGAVHVVTDVFVADLVNGSTFNPLTDVTVAGLTGGTPTLNTTDFNLLKGNFSVVFTGLAVSNQPFGLTQLDWPNVTHYVDITFPETSIRVTMYASDGSPSLLQGGYGTNSIQKGGAVVSDAGLKFCLNGGTVYSQAMLVPQTPVVNALIFAGHAGGGAVKTIAFYTGVLSDTTLQALTT